MDITRTLSSSSSSSSAPFFREDSSDSTSLLTPCTLRERRSTSAPSYGPIRSSKLQAHDQPCFPPHLHERQLTLIQPALESDIADQLHGATKPFAIPKDPIGPHITNLPRRVRVPAANLDTAPQHIRVVIQRASRQDECRCLHELVPGLFVAFEDDRLAFGDAAAGGPRDTLKTYIGEDFTHIVSLSAESAAGAPLVRVAGPEAHLALVLPAAQDTPDNEDDGNARPSLSRAQLLCARDFLSASNLRLTATAFSQSADVRILITTPRNRRVDALAVAACYLAAASGLGVDRVVEHFDDHEGGRYASVWQGVMDWREWGFLEGVARRR